MKFKVGDIIKKTYDYDIDTYVIFKISEIQDNKIYCLGTVLYSNHKKSEYSYDCMFKIITKASEVKKLKKSDLMLEEL